MECSTFELSNLHYDKFVEKEVSDIIENYKSKIKSKEKIKTIPVSKIDKNLENERWSIIQNSNIDFTKFGWVKEISDLFDIASNKGQRYIEKHFSEFYKTCYKRKSPTN